MEIICISFFQAFSVVRVVSVVPIIAIVNSTLSLSKFLREKATKEISIFFLMTA